MKLFGVYLVIFLFKEKRFPHKFLCSYVIVLQFIPIYIKNFPTKNELKTLKNDQIALKPSTRPKYIQCL